MEEKSIKNYSGKGTPVPACVVSEKGKILWANERIGEVFLYDGIIEADIFALVGVYYDDILAKSNRKEIVKVTINDRNYKLLVTKLEDGEIEIFFIDITNEVTATNTMAKRKTTIALVHVDNYDALIGQNNKKTELETQVDKKIRDLGEKLNAIVTRYKAHMYTFITEKQYIDSEKREDFPILEEMKKIETDVDFPVTLSVGIGAAKGEETFVEIESYADEALDLALGRGGDQVVIKEGDTISYFGGATENVERSNKGKSRIIAFAMRALVESASNVIIMGHKYPDMDSFGSALGVHRLARPLKKDTYILMDSFNETLSAIYKKAKDADEYNFITKEKALDLVKKNTLVIVVDVNRKTFTECPELLDIAERIVVIDHHRKGEESIKAATIAYTEPSASSASELVAEILQFGSEQSISKLEAEALLAGMFMDTNRFSVKTGVRTFDAAAWLRDKGADTTAVKRFFQVEYDMFKAKAECLAGATIIEGGIAIAICPGFTRDAQVINSQVADELLTIEGVKASFVAAKDEKGETLVSARSLGEVNVQIILEAFGGGGHLTTAGTQSTKTPEDILNEIVEYTEKTLAEKAKETAKDN